MQAHEHSPSAPEKAKRKVILVHLEPSSVSPLTLSRREELARLARALDLTVVGEVRQREERLRPGLGLGSGKLEELSNLVQATQADRVLFGRGLRYPVLGRLKERLGCEVLDRNQCILEIFSARALTAEGRIQVRLAGLEARLHQALSEERDPDRQRGGIGLRGGPGEAAPHLARRRIFQRRSRLRRKLEALKKRRREGRIRRQKLGAPQVSLAGYTNAGKSSLLNAWLDRDLVAARDRLFETLGPTTRTVGKSGILLTDTVGFLEDLPHHLVAAFESTLEAAVDGDLTLLVLEVEQPLEMERKLAAIQETLDRLFEGEAKTLLVLSKADRLEYPELAPFRDQIRAKYPEAVLVSARDRRGLEELEERIEACLDRSRETLGFRVGMDSLELLSKLEDQVEILERSWDPQGVTGLGRFRPGDRQRWSEAGVEFFELARACCGERSPRGANG